MTRGRAAVAGVLALVALSACGSVEQEGRGPSTTASAPTSTAPATTAPTTARTSAMPTTPSTPTGPTSRATPKTPPAPPEDLIVPPTRAGKHSTVRARGTVSVGVEPGCRLLTSKGVTYLLIWHGTLVTGQEIEVEGTVQPDLLTTCQQGTPLVVERVLRP